MDCDLHIHTRYSDGSMSVKDVIYFAAKMGLKYIAITDHDTISNADEAVRLGESAGVKVIPGAEATVLDSKTGRPVHVLCYLPDKKEIIQDFFDKTLAGRRKQKMEMISRVQKLYPLLETERVLEYASESGSIYMPHIMQPLCDLGYTNAAISDFQSSLFSKNGSCYVPDNYLDIEEFLQTAERAGAIVGIAHPQQYDSFELAEELAKEGRTQFIEYDHPRNGAEGRKRIKEIAQKYDLIMTGGSDFHGQYAKNPNPIGSYGCSCDVAEQLLQLKMK